jgi:hypothetical protein
MAGLTKIEQFLIDLGVGYEEVGANTWIVDDESRGIYKLAITFNDPVVVIRAAVMQVPTQKRLELFEALLRLNASDLPHGAYGLEGDKIVMVDSLEYDTMDKSEFEASLDAIGFALSQHYPKLSQLLK